MCLRLTFQKVRLVRLPTYCLNPDPAFSGCSVMMELGAGSTEQGMFCPFLNIAFFIINLTTSSVFISSFL